MACTTAAGTGSALKGSTTLCIGQSHPPACVAPAAPQGAAVAPPRLNGILVLVNTLGGQTGSSSQHISHHTLIAQRAALVFRSDQRRMRAWQQAPPVRRTDLLPCA